MLLNLNRREFIEFAIASLAAGSVPRFMMAAPKISALDAIGKERGKWFQEVGAKYQLIRPDEANETLLEQKILAGWKPDLPLNTFLTDQIVRECKQGKLILLDGWQYSLTEARLCLLMKIGKKYKK